MKTHKALKITCITVAILLVGLGIAALIWYNFFFTMKGTVSNPVDTLPLTDEISTDAAVSDLNYIYDMLKERHPCYLDGSDIPAKAEEAFNTEKALLEQRDTVTVCELWRSAARLLKTVGDGHTIARAYSNDVLYVNDVSELHDCELVSIDGVSADSLLADFKTVFSYEPQVEFYADYVFRHQAIIRELYLQLLGIDTSDGVDYEIVTAGGERKTVHLTFTTAENVIGNDSAATELYRMTFDEDKSLAIFAFDDFETSDEYKNALEKFFAEVKAKDIENVAIDLRENGGGTTNATLLLMDYFDVDKYLLFGGVDVRNGNSLTINRDNYTENEKQDNLFNGNIYVLTSNNTFSTAMDFACVIQDNHLGTVIGEVPGNMPSAYGDKLTFQCPNSKLVFCISYKKFHRIDSSKDSEPLVPDYEVEADKALDKLYEVIAK